MSWKRLKDETIKERLKMRARIVQLIREFFISEGFWEVETPIVVPSAGQEPYLNPMKVEFTAPPQTPPPGGGEKDISSPFEGEVRRGYLITSPEYSHKKLLAAGFEKTFEITRAFRSGEHFGGLHNPEFTMIEWYRANADYTAIMEDVENMVAHVMKALKHKNIKAIEYQGRSIDLSSPWERLSVKAAFQKCANTNLDEVPDEETFFKTFLTHIEPKLGQNKPTILYDYPASMAALARVRPPLNLPLAKGEKEGVAERFEVYIAGMELGNAFSELNDAKEQRRRFMEEQKLRKKLGKEIIPLDEDFLDAVDHMPPSAGIAFGVDRLVMLLTNAKNIEDVLAFPAKHLFETNV